MGTIILAIIFLLICGVVVFLIEFWWVLLIFAIIAVVVALIVWSAYSKKIKNAISAEIINEEPIIERRAENTGYSIGYGKHLSSREYYRYKNVITGYKVKFNVLLKNGKYEVIQCNKDSATYKILINKTNTIKNTVASKTSTVVTPTISLSKQNALRQAKLYLNSLYFSHQGLVKQLEYDKYPHEDAVYAANNCGANWNEQAAKAAKSYLKSSPFSKERLIEQLEYDGFTHEQAIYGVTVNGY